MKKLNKVLLGIAASGLLINPLQAQTQEDLKLLIMKMQERLDKYEKQREEDLKKLQAYMEQVKTESTNEKQTDAIKNNIGDIEERLDVVEMRSYLDKIQLGLGFKTEANNIQTKYANGSSPAKEDIIFRTKLNINMKASISDSLKFTGRLSSYKNWGDSNVDGLAFATIDSRQGRTPDNSSAVYLERAYLDYEINPNDNVPVTLTIGRQPSSDGPSYQIKEGLERKGTYDALALDGAADGIVLTANLNKYLENTSFRVAYGIGSNTSNNNSATSTVKDTKLTGYFLDKSIKGFGENNLFQVYYVTAKDFNADASGLSGANDVNIGDYDIYGAMFEVQNISNFDAFLHIAKSEAKPNGQYLGYDINGDGTVSAGEGFGLLTTNGMGTYEDKSGHAFWLGARYNLGTWAIGAEYNKGSKNWFSLTYAPNDPLNKLATRGDAYEIYISKSISRFANFRLGYIDINYDYTGSGMHVGSPISINDPAAALNIKEKTNTYLTFNVLF